MPTEKELIEERIKKRDKLQELGINPYPYSYEVENTAKELQDRYKDLEAGKETKDKVKVAGRIIGLRRMGKATFMHIQDQTGKIQAFFSKDDNKNYDLLKFYDMGDFIGIEGLIFKTKRGEATVKASEFEMLGKSLRPLPDKWHGVKDVEIRYRKRYLDLIMNPEVKEVFETRAKIIKTVRNFLDERGFTEVETPVLQALYGGTNAMPFKTHMNTLDQDMYLRIAPELYLKRLVVGGFLKVYELGKNFRNEDADTGHNPEFTMLEFYEAFADYHKMMDTAEEMYKTIAKKVFGTTKVKIGEREIDLKGKWPRVEMTEAIKKELALDVENMSLDELKECIEEHRLDFRGTPSKGLFIFTLFDKLVADKLEGPVWIIDYPKEISPLAKPHRSKKGWVERFECYVAGREIGDGWSELIDPAEQRARFENEQKQMRAGNKEAHPLDEEFLEALEYGMPVLGGIGIGIDRLTMFFTNKQSIRDVMLFPFMKQ